MKKNNNTKNSEVFKQEFSKAKKDSTTVSKEKA